MTRPRQPPGAFALHGHMPGGVLTEQTATHMRRRHQTIKGIETGDLVGLPQTLDESAELG